MSGYLQRLVQTAAQPAETVHPFAGSVFTRYEDEPRWVESEETVVAESRKSAAPILSSTRQNVPESDTRRKIARALEYRPTAPVSPAVPIQPERGRDVVQPVAEEQLLQPAPLIAPAPKAEPHRDQPQPRVLPDYAFRPLVANDVLADEVRIGPARMRASSRSPHDSHHAAAAELESDDIQIHIGRIEVTAVHPLAPRAPKAPDRSLSLDAYLNRRAR
jgi:hypothetical protein